MLEDVIDGAPRWKILREALDKHSNLKHDKRPPVIDYLRDKYGFRLSSAQWLELATEVAAKAYGLFGHGGLFDTAVAQASDADMKIWANQLRGDRDLAHALGTLAARALVSKTATLPPELDEHVTQYGLSREILEAIPAKRRTAS